MGDLRKVFSLKIFLVRSDFYYNTNFPEQKISLKTTMYLIGDHLENERLVIFSAMKNVCMSYIR